MKNYNVDDDGHLVEAAEQESAEFEENLTFEEPEDDDE